MQMQILQAVELLSRSERMLGLLGIGPSNPKDTRFAVILGYLIIHVSLEYADLIQFLNNIEHVVINLTQSITFTVIILKVILLRWNNREIGAIIEIVKKDFRAAFYQTTTERRVFLESYSKARRIITIAIPSVFFTATCTYLAPIIDLLETVNKNGTTELRLPYHTRMFYDVTKVRAYTLTYIVQLPFVLISALGHVGPDCLFVTLILHICGQLAVLVERIDNLSTKHQEYPAAIKRLVKMHVRLMSTTMSLVEVYNVLLLAQVLAGMLLICILSYDLLVNTEEGQGFMSANFVNFSNYILSITLLIFTYCYVAENLIEQSTRVHRAFSECGWEDMPTRHAKSIMICIARSQKPLGLSAGKFYTLSYSSFTGIMKTSMAYFSVLRNLL